MAEFQKPPISSTEELKRDIDNLFSLFDKIEWLQFVGGEIFTHRHLDEVFKHCRRYDDKFDRLIIETNSTIMPTDREFEALLSFGDKLKVMISDYGELSKVRDELTVIFDKNNVEYVLKKYYGDDQHFGGWIDNSEMHDIGETDEEIEIKAAGCPQVRLQNMHCFRGKLHRCSNSLFISALGRSSPNTRDFVDLNDEAVSKDEKIAVIDNFYKTATATCRYCRWKDADDAELMARFGAAEQV
jgi:MoaA/NifB/PqqE/SkfB family radical SAM enzyme